MDFADPETAPTILPFTKFEIMEESEMLWARLLAYATGTVNQELLLRNEYLAAENRILRGQIKGRLLLSEGEKATLAEAQRADDLLRAVLHPLGESPSETRRIHAVPGSGVDGAAGAQHDDGGVGKPERLPLSAA
jgi:hypothetical protein